MEWHMRSGYTVLGLILFRFIWGFSGPAFARFSQFIQFPKQVFKYAKELVHNKSHTYHGHNPLGGWMVVVLLLLCLLQAGTGLFANDEIFTEGPLVHLINYDLSVEITRWHKTLFDVLLAAIGLHLLGVASHQWGKKEPLIQAMVHGRKPSNSEFQPQSTPWFKGLLVAAIAATSVWALINL